MNESQSLLVLNAVKGIGNAGIRKLLECFGSAGRVLSLHEKELMAQGRIKAETARNITSFRKTEFLKAETELMHKRGVRVVTWSDPDYPGLLREIPDAPVVLYVKGALPDRESLSIAIVGSRRATVYGVLTAEKLARQLASYGVHIISGLARGIDTAAHNGALAAKTPTVAVLGCGLDHIYPLDNKDLMDRIAGNGAVISEFPMRMPPIAANFPRRNRVISGLSKGVVVVEAARRSGALITARFALEQGRDVFAVPGKIDQPTSFGVHDLIKQGAKLVTGVEDILQEFNPAFPSRTEQFDDGPLSGRAAHDRVLSSLNEFERKVMEYIKDKPVHIDELTKNCRMDAPVMSVLLQLELRHLVKQLPGKRFVNDGAAYGRAKPGT